MSKIVQESLATLISGLYLGLLLVSFFLFSTLTFCVLLVLPLILCIPILLNFIKPPLFFKKGFSFSKTPKEDAYHLLGLPVTASPEEVIETHKRLAAINHPDRGGSVYLVQLIDNAKKTITEDYEASRAEVLTKDTQ